MRSSHAIRGLGGTVLKTKRGYGTGTVDPVHADAAATRPATDADAADREPHREENDINCPYAEGLA